MPIDRTSAQERQRRYRLHEASVSNSLVLAGRLPSALELQRVQKQLDECRTIGEAKSIHDAMHAIKDVLASQGVSKTLRDRAATITLNAQRVAGKLLIEQKEKGERARKGRQKSQAGTIGKVPTLQDLRIERHRADRWQALARIPEKTYQDYLRRQAEDPEGEVTRTGAFKAASISGDADYDGDESCTPSRYVELVRAVLGGIDVDPATNEGAQQRIRATHYYTKEDSGLEHEWHGRVFNNPPYSAGLVDLFADKFLAEYAALRMTAGILLVNNSTDTGWFQRCLHTLPACFPRGRIQFETHEGKPVGPSNRYAQAFFYAGPDTHAFVAHFSEVGEVVRRVG